MKKRFALILCSLAMVCWSGMASTAGASITIAASEYAMGSGTIATNRQVLANAEVYDTLYDDKPVGENGVNFVSLGLGGSLILSLNGGSIIDSDGTDFILFETTYDSNADNWDSYKETANVYVYNGQYNSNVDDWVYLGEARQDGHFDLSTIILATGFTTAIKIVDISLNYGQTGDGYDVDGLSLIHTSTVPLPGAAILFGSGLLGLVGLRRREIV
jgi:hypothetical protein